LFIRIGLNNTCASGFHRVKEDCNSINRSKTALALVKQKKKPHLKLSATLKDYGTLPIAMEKGAGRASYEYTLDN
jgi:hypothetical protein